jgi:hypothetical protein
MSKKKFLYEVDVRMVQRIVVAAESQAEALEVAKSVTVVLQVDDDKNKVVLLGDDPHGNDTGYVDLLAEEGTPEWKYHFGGVQ